MSGNVERRVEEMLRSDAADARRAPSPGLRARVSAAIESDAAVHGGAPSLRGSWRGRVRDGLVAASVLVAAALWGFAFLRLSPKEPASLVASAGAEPDAAGFTWKGALDAVQGSASPQRLSIAIDSSLFGELENISQDALRAARFLAGRIPAPLVEGDATSSSR
jgi:hypothetical protein